MAFVGSKHSYLVLVLCTHFLNKHSYTHALPNVEQDCTKRSNPAIPLNLHRVGIRNVSYPVLSSSDADPA